MQAQTNAHAPPLPTTGARRAEYEGLKTNEANAEGVPGRHVRVPGGGLRVPRLPGRMVPAAVRASRVRRLPRRPRMPWGFWHRSRTRGRWPNQNRPARPGAPARELESVTRGSIANITIKYSIVHSTTIIAGTKGKEKHFIHNFATHLGGVVEKLAGYIRDLHLNQHDSINIQDVLFTKGCYFSW